MTSNNPIFASCTEITSKAGTAVYDKFDTARADSKGKLEQMEVEMSMQGQALLAIADPLGENKAIRNKEVFYQE